MVGGWSAYDDGYDNGYDNGEPDYESPVAGETWTPLDQQTLNATLGRGEREQESESQRRRARGVHEGFLWVPGWRAWSSRGRRESSTPEDVTGLTPPSPADIVSTPGRTRAPAGSR